MTACLIMMILILTSDIPTNMITHPITMKLATIMMKLSHISEISDMLMELIIEWISSLMVNGDMMHPTTDTQASESTIFRTTVTVMMLILLCRSMDHILHIIMR